MTILYTLIVEWLIIAIVLIVAVSIKEHPWNDARYKKNYPHWKRGVLKGAAKIFFGWPILVFLLVKDEL